MNHWSTPLAPCPGLHLRDVALRAGPRVLVEHLSMAIAPGEFWCVVGPTGVGKSTLMGVLAGLRAPDGGEVRIDDTPVTRAAPAALARQRAYLPQAVHDTFSMAVQDAARVGRHPHMSGWGWGQGDDDRVVRDVMTELDLDALTTRDVLTLSGGERQRAVAGRRPGPAGAAAAAGRAGGPPRPAPPDPRAGTAAPPDHGGPPRGRRDPARSQPRAPLRHACAADVRRRPRAARSRPGCPYPRAVLPGAAHPHRQCQRRPPYGADSRWG